MDDGNNVLAVAPGVVIAYERNVDTNTRCGRRALKSLPSREVGWGVAVVVRAA